MLILLLAGLAWQWPVAVGESEPKYETAEVADENGTLAEETSAIEQTHGDGSVPLDREEKDVMEANDLEQDCFDESELWIANLSPMEERALSQWLEGYGYYGEINPTGPLGQERFGDYATYSDTDLASLSDNANDAKAQLVLGERLLEKGKWEAAEERLWQAVVNGYTSVVLQMPWHHLTSDSDLSPSERSKRNLIQLVAYQRLYVKLDGPMAPLVAMNLREMEDPDPGHMGRQLDSEGFAEAKAIAEGMLNRIERERAEKGIRLFRPIPPPEAERFRQDLLEIIANLDQGREPCQAVSH